MSVVKLQEQLVEPLCSSIGTELFYPDKNESHLAIIAKKVCDSCEIKTECLEYAVLYETYGIWGGMTARERAAYRKTNKIQFIGYPGNGPYVI